MVATDPGRLAVGIDDYYCPARSGSQNRLNYSDFDDDGSAVSSVISGSGDDDEYQNVLRYIGNTLHVRRACASGEADQRVADSG